MITDPALLRFEDVWPEVSARLTGCLVRRGTPADQAEDLVQETALRALQGGITFTDADDLFRWSAVVARRLAIDAHRRRRFLADGEPPDRASSDRVEHQVETRIVLAAVSSAVKDLTTTERQALLSVPAGRGVGRREAVRLNVSRHRARARLRAGLDGLVGVAIALGVRVRRWIDVVSPSAAELTSYAFATLVVVAAGTIGLGSDRSSASDARSAATAPRTDAAWIAPRPPTAAEAAQATAPLPRPSATRQPVAGVVVPLPGAPPATVGVDQAGPDDHLACLWVKGAETCADAPVTVPSPPLP